MEQSRRAHTVYLESQFKGTLLAPNGTLNFRALNGLRHEGEFYAKHIKTEGGAQVLHIPSSCLMILALFLGSACSSGPQGLPPIEFEAAVVWESEHFEYYVQEGDDSVCEGVMETLERHFAAIHEYLGFPWPEGRKIKYYKILETDDAADFGCMGESTACYRGHGEIVSSEVFHRHELIHAYVGPIDYDSDTPRPSYLQEGLAEALGTERIVGGTTPQPWREFFALSAYDSPVLHEQGAWFVGHLLNHYPLEKFMAWFLSVEYGDSVEKMAKQFEKAYGRTVDEVWDEAYAVSPREFQPVLAFECSEPAISPDEGEIHIDGAACDGSHFRTLRVDGKTTVALHSTSILRPGLLSCEEQGWLSWQDARFLGLASEGNYLVYSPEDEFLSFSFEELLSDAFVDDCETAVPVRLPEVEQGLSSIWTTINVPLGEWYVTLESPPGKHSLKIGPLQNLTLEQCDTCQGTCTSLNNRDVFDFGANGQVLLRLDGKPTKMPEPSTLDHLRYARIDLRRE